LKNSKIIFTHPALAYKAAIPAQNPHLRAVEKTEIVLSRCSAEFNTK
jgi:hypothetical protein